MGEKAGHPFRGNQWGSAAGGASSGAVSSRGDYMTDAAVAHKRIADWHGKMTQQEQDALDDLTGNGFAKINSELREGKADDPRIEHLDSAFSKASPLPEPIVVHRGFQGRGADKLRKVKVGETFTDEGYSSTSLKERIARSFRKRFSSDPGQYASIIVPKGTRVLAGVELEKEVLLPRGSRFKVVSKSDAGIELELVR